MKHGCGQLELPLFDMPGGYAGQAEAFDFEHPQVWACFERFALAAVGQGHVRYSADAIMHRVRWETDVVCRRGEAFKINNNYVAWYARKFMAVHPELDGFFGMRKAKKTEV